MALGITVTRTMPLFPLGAFIQWDLVNPTESGIYSFSIYRGYSPAGPWEPLALNVANVMNYIDRVSTTQAVPTAPNQLALSRNTLYRVTATPPSGATNAAEVISSIEPRLVGKQRLLRRKLLRDEAKMLRRINGVEIAVLKRMRWGTRCPKCYDKYAKEVVRGNCTTCFGTSFTGGYHAPVVTLGRRSVGPVETSLAPQGKTDIAQSQLTMLDAPVVEADDIVVFLRDNRRFLVTKQIQTEIQTVSVHQKLLVSELARSSVEYRIPVDPLRIPALF